MKRSFIIIGLTVGLLFGMMSCTSKNSSSNTVIVPVVNDSTNIELAKVSADFIEESAPVNSIEHTSVDSTKKDTFRYKRKGPFIENDTTFLYRFSTNAHGYYDYEDIYIEKDRQSESYQQTLKRASTYLLDDHDQTQYTFFYKLLKEKHPLPLTQHSLADLPKAWMRLRSFQNTYYINDLDIYNLCWFNDSLYIKHDMEGPVLSAIYSFEQITPTHYHFVLAQGTIRWGLDLQIIDSERKIAVFTPSGKRKEKILYVAQETAHLFDLINWKASYPIDNTHIDFDKIDFDTLLKQQK